MEKIKKSQLKKIIIPLIVLLVTYLASEFGLSNSVDKRQIETIAGVIGDQVLGDDKIEESEGIQTSENLTKATVISIVDGDTIKAKIENGEDVSIRLIGIDTPESVHPDKTKNTPEGKEVSEYVSNIIKTGDTIRIEYDVAPTDRYGRHLAYVYFDSENGRIMLNKHLLEKGYAKISTHPPNVKYVEKFLDIQLKAQESEAGFWKDVWVE